MAENKTQNATWVEIGSEKSSPEVQEPEPLKGYKKCANRLMCESEVFQGKETAAFLIKFAATL